MHRTKMARVDKVIEEGTSLLPPPASRDPAHKGVRRQGVKRLSAARVSKLHNYIAPSPINSLKEAKEEHEATGISAALAVDFPPLTPSELELQATFAAMRQKHLPWTLR